MMKSNLTDAIQSINPKWWSYMKVALRNSYIEYVLFMGVAESYPPWFAEILYDQTYGDESRYTFYVYHNERTMDYYEKQLIEDYSVILRKPNGEVHVTDWDVFQELYVTFTYSEFNHSGIAAFQDDCIDYVECQAGVLPAGYPSWFYEFFTEAFNYPQDGETLFLYDADTRNITARRDSILADMSGCVTVTEHSIFLRNRFGEIRGMRYDEFLKYYDPSPEIGEW